MIPLHVKSEYSIGLGTASIEELVRWGAERRVPSLALTDLENLRGQIRFHCACRARGIEPITGVELRPGFNGRRNAGSKEGRLVLLARDRVGYANLCRIVSRRRARTSSSPGSASREDPIASARGLTEGLFVMTDHVPTLARILTEEPLPVSAVRLLLVRPGTGASPETEVLRAAGEFGVSLVGDVDAVMIRSADHALHRLLLATHRKAKVHDAEVAASLEAPERSLDSLSRAEELFGDQPAAIEETVRVARACRLDLCAHERIPLSEREILASAELEEACRIALQKGRLEGRWLGDEYDERLKHEVGTISTLGFASYFLTVAEIVSAARERGILTAGRGSAAGSLVAHVLGLTQVDPLALGLYFERFLHPGRADPPDIDIDVDSNRRHELIDWVRHRFGRERVAMVSTHQTFQPRSVLREGLRALGVSPSELARVARQLPPDAIGGGSVDVVDSQQSTVDSGIVLPEGESSEGDGPAGRAFDAIANTVPQAFRGWIPIMRRLIGKPRHLSVHPGGVVLAFVPLESCVPLERAPGGVVVTQYDLRSIEEAGLLKIDLLGNHALAELDETYRLLTREGARDGRAITEWSTRIPYDDEGTLRRLDAGDTMGCFQIESPAVRSVLRRLPVRGLEDVIAALAVVRPGAAAGRAKETFLQRARGLETPQFLHPALARALAATYGVPLYEEDILFLLHELGCVSVGRADELRAAIVRLGDQPAEVRELEAAFLREAAANECDEEGAKAAWSAATRFAAYSFSRAHAASYALLAYHTAYLKTHHPVEFACALLDHHAGMYPRRTIAADIARQGVRILLPSVNHSAIRCGLETSGGRGAVRTGLALVKYLRRSSVEALLSSRAEQGPFRDMSDLLDRASLSAPELRALVLTGACDDLPPLSPEAYPFVHQALLVALSGDLSPAGFSDRVARAAHVLRANADAEKLNRYRALVRMRNELEYLEMHISDHPMRVLRGDADRLGCVPTNLLPSLAGQFVRVAALVAAARRVRTRRGDVMQFITLEDEHGTVEATVFPAVYRRLGNRIVTPGPFLVAGGVVENDGDINVAVSDLDSFHERRR
jgi:DNA-directed DNA polymerase III PolC